MSTTPSSTDLANIGRTTKTNAIRGIIVSVVINGAFPFLIYWALTNYTSISSFLALVATGIPSLLHSLVGLLRQKRIDFLAGLVLAGIAVSVIITVLWRPEGLSDPRVILYNHLWPGAADFP